MATRLGVSQATVWRYDNARTVPPIPIVAAWLDHCGVAQTERDRILGLAEAAHAETRPWRTLLDEAPHLQDTAREREVSAGLVRNFQPTLVPGLLQTPEYAARVIALADLTGQIEHEAALAARLNRQQVLFDTARRFEFLLTPRVLTWSPGTAELMPTQRDRIVSVSGLESVRIGVLPEDQTAALLWHPFTLWRPIDGPAYVSVESFHGEEQLDAPDDVAVYELAWKRLWEAAVTGDEALGLIRSLDQRRNRNVGGESATRS